MGERKVPATVDALRRARLASRRAGGGPPTQAWLAERLRVTQTAVSYWESGKRLPDVATVEDWAFVLGYALTLQPIIEEPS